MLRARKFTLIASNGSKNKDLTLDPSILFQVQVLSLKQLGFIKIKWEEVVH